MRPAHPLEAAVGMAYYASDADGTGGRLKATPEDFRVREIERLDAEPVDADPDRFPHLLVRATLRGWDTNDFARALSDRLGISRERVAWAGTKDKRAVTTQLLSIDGVVPRDLPTVPDAEIEPVGRLGRALRFGDLAGNAFSVTVRDPDRPGQVDAVTAALRSFGAAGDGGSGSGSGGTGGADAPIDVPNYFGQQRFGSRRPVTHRVGLAILDRDWRGAVLAYVGGPSDREPTDARAARTYVEETMDWAGGLERMPTRLRNERAILHRLVEAGAEAPDDFRAALAVLPTNLQRLLVNAAQSYAFNRMLSARLERGLPFARAVPGDVVCFAETVDGLVVPDAGRRQRVTADNLATVNRHAERGRAFVTAPLVGTDTELGDGEPGEIERAVLSDIGIAPADFDLPGAFGSTGTRRPVLLRTAVVVDRDPLRFAFDLPKGSYATVVMREYLKVDPGAME